MQYTNNASKFIPNHDSLTQKKLIRGKMSKQNGIIPFSIVTHGTFKPAYSGNFDYYKTLTNTAKPSIELIDVVIYTVGTEVGNA
jgi:hypothetical protein